MIALDHVSLKPGKNGPYNGPHIEDVSIEVQKGEIFGIAGPAGSGKSTLLKFINGLIKPDSGRILIDDKNILELGLRDMQLLRRRAAMLFTKPAFMEKKSVLQNMMLPLIGTGKATAQMREEIEALLALVGAGGTGDALPFKLSSALRQRIAIARALMTNPEILLCDEIFNDLEPDDAQGIILILSQLHRELGLTLLITTSQIDIIKRICNRAAIIKDGKLIELNDTYSLFAKPQEAFTRAFLASQLAFDLPDEVKEHAFGTIVRIDYMGDSANEPVLYEVSQRYGVEYNILQGRIEYIGGMPLGKMFVSFESEPELMALVLGYLKENTHNAEVIFDARRN